jgi:hypothetical protein
MATPTYLAGRKKYQRPQAMLWSENAGTLSNGLYIPTGLEIGSDPGSETNTAMFDQFLILSDDNRGPIDFRPTRIEKRERMVNGRMRSYHIADKMTIDVSWQMLPSRSFYTIPDFNSTTGTPTVGGYGRPNFLDEQYTTDGGAGGVELLDWYKNHTGSFWVYLAYDNYANFGKNEDAYGHLGQYNELIEMFFADFQYTVVKRGGSNYDFWNVSLTLEEV